MRPNTPEGIKAEAEELAKGDIERHRKHNHDLNVFSTPGGREDWQRGFDNAGARGWARTVEYDTFYQRGRAVARLLEQEAKEPK